MNKPWENLLYGDDKFWSCKELGVNMARPKARIPEGSYISEEGIDIHWNNPVVYK